MENIYTVMREKSSLRKFCYRHGYRLERVISDREVDINIISRFLASQGVDFSSSSDHYRGYHIRVSRGGKLSRFIGYILNLFSEDSSVTIKIRDSFAIEETLPFSV